MYTVSLLAVHSRRVLVQSPHRYAHKKEYTTVRSSRPWPLHIRGVVPHSHSLHPPCQHICEHPIHHQHNTAPQPSITPRANTISPIPQHYLLHCRRAVPSRRLPTPPTPIHRLPPPNCPRAWPYRNHRRCVDQVSAFYRKRNPDKLSEVAALCTKYEGRERKLVKKLRRKYEGRY